jgi:ABC-2 type transport system ATP-binding protein
MSKSLSDSLGATSVGHPTHAVGGAVADDPSDPVIRARHLVKRFGRVIALDGLDLTVGRGQVHGFIGPNGAGKSTTIRAMLGQLG